MDPIAKDAKDSDLVTTTWPEDGFHSAINRTVQEMHIAEGLQIKVNHGKNTRWVGTHTYTSDEVKVYYKKDRSPLHRDHVCRCSDMQCQAEVALFGVAGAT